MKPIKYFYFEEFQEICYKKHHFLNKYCFNMISCTKYWNNFCNFMHNFRQMKIRTNKTHKLHVLFSHLS